MRNFKSSYKSLLVGTLYVFILVTLIVEYLVVYLIFTFLIEYINVAFPIFSCTIQKNVQMSVTSFVYAGTFVSKDKVLQMMQTNHEEEITSYKQTICRLKENNRQMLEEINNLKQALELHQSAIDLQIEASGWTNTDI